jgi:hypothetical protein
VNSLIKVSIDQRSVDYEEFKVDRDCLLPWFENVEYDWKYIKWTKEEVCEIIYFIFMK